MNKSDAMSFFGSQKKLSEALGITHSSVSQWPDRIPEKQALKLDRMTNGKLKYDESDYRGRPRKASA